MKFDVMVDVRLRGGIADPAGATIERALPALGYDGVADVTVGKTVRFAIEATDEAEATRRSEDGRRWCVQVSPRTRSTRSHHLPEPTRRRERPCTLACS